MSTTRTNKSPKRIWTRPQRPLYDRTVHEVLHLVRNSTAAEIGRQTWVSPSTIRRWRLGYEHGGTRHPQFETLKAVAEVAGFEFKLVKKDTKP